MADRRGEITNNRANVWRSPAESTKDEQAGQEALSAERQQQEALQQKHYTRRTVLEGLAVVVGVGLTATVAAGCDSSPNPNTGPKPTATAQANIVATATAPVTPQFNVYTDFNDPGNHYVPSGFMGDFKDITLTQDWTAHPHSGGTCIRVVYSGIATQGKKWAGVYWQAPENNWGTIPGSTGYDLSHYSKLSFWVRGELGVEHIQFLVGGIAGIITPYPDSSQTAVKTPVIKLTTDWQPQNIPLEGENLTHIIGGFGWIAKKTDNPKGATFYLDDIVYLA